MPDVEPISIEAKSPEVKITVRPNGPFRVEGPVRLIDADGKEWNLEGKPAISLCRCGRLHQEAVLRRTALQDRLSGCRISRCRTRQTRRLKLHRAGVDLILRLRLPLLALDRWRDGRGRSSSFLHGRLAIRYSRGYFIRLLRLRLRWLSRLLNRSVDFRLLESLALNRS